MFRRLQIRRISNAKNVVRRDEEVYVKVISISGQKLSLSIRDVDQHTGKDLVPLKKKRSEEDDTPRTNPQGPRDGHGNKTGLSGIRIMDEDDAVPPCRRALKRMSLPERWEAKQLIAAGVLSVTEHPMYDEETDGMPYQEEGAEEQTEIDNNEDLPQFLLGEGGYFGEMSPVRIQKGH